LLSLVFQPLRGYNTSGSDFVHSSNQSNIPPFINWLERKLCHRPPLLSQAGDDAPALDGGQAGRPLKDGMTIAVVGGGLAGPLFARQLLALTRERGPNIKVVILDQTDCNYCAGLMTALAGSSLQNLYGLSVPEEVILTTIGGCIFVNSADSTCITVNNPLVSMLRTDRFGEAGFDDALKYRLLTGLEDMKERLEIIEPVTVNEIRVPQGEAPGQISYRRQGERRTLEADVIAVATGLRTLDRPMMHDFIAQTGFRPPETMIASVTEVDASGARHNVLGNRIIIADNLLPNTMVGIIPKRPNWITVSALHRRLSCEEIGQLFTHPQVCRWIDIPHAEAALRCHTVCGARVCTTPAKNFYGDGWLVLGDLTGYQRVLKDGYSACMVGSTLAARCLVNYGASAKSLARHYHIPLARAFSARDNQRGMALFYLNERLASRGRRARRAEGGSLVYPEFSRGSEGGFPALLMEAANAEQQKHPYGGLVHAALRALLTGEISYTALAPMLVAGLVGYYAPRPARLLKHLFARIPNPQG